ncbi:hypothetical protein S7335_2077 [Synechococcus sp. PCC 7335]|uniref:hypothetical protein n=1 Tax=Synechococcus sp. (strain ATCC 29403 / PCC 7335) TaxID=91464 RepID=UPI00017EE095|nr:hypothetical protein [Synechococcus sp. PCC 7335]EDX84380.1 hypothetical protein S7335_2077 [Synechococcus sp. PCC 7335]
MPNLINSLEDHDRFVEQVSTEIANGENSSLSLLHLSAASKNIKHHIPDAKLIAVLQNHVERGYSDFLFSTDRNSEPIYDFVEAIETESKRIQKNYWFRWHYQQQGFYFRQIKRHFDLFLVTQVRVCLYAESKKNTSKVLRDIFQFFQVDDSFISNSP